MVKTKINIFSITPEIEVYVESNNIYIEINYNYNEMKVWEICKLVEEYLTKYRKTQWRYDLCNIHIKRCD